MVPICDSGAERLHLAGAIPPLPLLAQVRDTIQVKHYNTRAPRLVAIGLGALSSSMASAILPASRLKVGSETTFVGPCAPLPV